MTFLLGVIVGVLLAYGIVALGFILHYRYKQPMSMLTHFENAVKPKGSILLPKDDATLRQERIIAENDAAGRDTKLSEL